MSQNVRRIKLSEQDVSYLKQASFFSPIIKRQIDEMKSGACILHLSHDLAEEYRSEFTDRLAFAGFDENYELTTEGQQLEELIDKFFVDAV